MAEAKMNRVYGLVQCHFHIGDLELSHDSSFSLSQITQPLLMIGGQQMPIPHSCHGLRSKFIWHPGK